jgi:hypothetical protein
LNIYFVHTIIPIYATIHSYVPHGQDLDTIIWAGSLHQVGGEKLMQSDLDKIRKSIKRDPHYFDGDPFANLRRLPRQILDSGLEDDEKAKRFAICKMVARLAMTNYRLHGDKSKVMDVWVKAFSGDNNLLIRLLSVIPEFAGAKWVSCRVETARKAGDYKFLKAYSEALARPAKIHGRTNIKLMEYLMLNWIGVEAPLCEMKDIDIWRELIREGIIEGKPTPSSNDLKKINKYIERLNLRSGKKVAT